MTVLSKSLFSFMSSHFMAFSFSATGHNNSSMILKNSKLDILPLIHDNHNGFLK